MLIRSLIFAATAAASFVQSPRPTLLVDRFGMPSGHETPEGVACDFAQAFIRADPSLVLTSCVPPFGERALQDQFHRFDTLLMSQVTKRDKDGKRLPGAPKRLLRVFAARRLTHKGIDEVAKSLYGFKAVRFVDIMATLNSGQNVLNRTLVVQMSDGKWFVDPWPKGTPKISDGLNSENPSTRLLQSAYQLKQKP